jgi:hypothetical protein
LWNKIPREERKDYSTLVKVVAVYDEETRTAPQNQNPTSLPKRKPEMQQKERSKSDNKTKPPDKRECFFCGKKGHISKDCPNKKLIAVT